MFEKNVTKSSNQPTWSDILNTIRRKAECDLKLKVVPAVNSGRTVIGILLVALGQKIQGSNR